VSGAEWQSHDLRRTSAHELSRAGVPEPIAMAIMGHKTRAMYDRYNIVDEDDIRSALTQVEQHRARRGYNLATSPPEQAEQEGSTKI
jgi:integrase